MRQLIRAEQADITSHPKGPAAEIAVTTVAEVLPSTSIEAVLLVAFSAADLARDEDLLEARR